MHRVNLTQNVLPTLDLVEGEDINLAGTKGDRVMINQTPGLAWERPYGNGLRLGLAGGTVEVPTAEGGLYGKPEGTWCLLLQDTKTGLHTFDDSPEHMSFNWVLYCKCHSERGSEINWINHRAST